MRFALCALLQGRTDLFIDAIGVFGVVSPSTDFLPIRQDKVKNRDLTPFAP
jgi:hypothetical protein